MHFVRCILVFCHCWYRYQVHEGTQVSQPRKGKTTVGGKKLNDGFPVPPLAVSNDKSTTQRLSVFVGHAPGVSGYPSLCFIPDKLLSPWRVSSGNQPDSLWPGTIYNMYNGLFTIKICTILYTIPFTINKNTLVCRIIQFFLQPYFTEFSLAELNYYFKLYQ